MKKGYELEFETKIEINNDDNERDVLVTARGKCYRELYGADADGNRGVMQTEVEIYNLKVVDMNTLADLTEEVEKDNIVSMELLEEAEEVFIKDFYGEVCDE